MNFMESIRAAQDSVTVKRVYGEPYERDGVVVIPAATLLGGGGGGSGDQGDGNTGSGGGVGFAAWPIGAYVIRDGEVSWRPTVDLNMVIFGGQVLALTGLLVARSIARRRR